MGDYDDKMSDKKLEANVSLLFSMEDNLLPSSPTLPEQEQQEMVEEEDEKEENVPFCERPSIFKPLSSADNL